MTAPPRSIMLALSLLALQCSVLTTFDGYVALEDTADAGDAEAGTQTSDGEAAGDATSNATAADTGMLDGGARRWCDTVEPSPKFCDDFDNQGPFSNWTSQLELNGTSLARDTASFTSAPNALLAVSPGASSSCPAFLRFVPPGIVKHLTFAFDFRINARDPKTAYAEVAYVHLANGSDFYLRVYADPTLNGYTAESYPDGSALQHNVTFPKSISFDTWKRISVDIDLGAGHAINVTVNGANVMSQALESSLYPPGTASADPGLGYTGSPSGVWKMRFDNVTIDWD